MHVAIEWLLVVLIIVEAVRRAVLVRVVLWRALVMLVVHMFRRLLGLMVGTFAVPGVHSYGAISLSPSKSFGVGKTNPWSRRACQLLHQRT